MRKNNGRLKKSNWCKASKQQKRLLYIKMCIKCTLYVNFSSKPSYVLHKIFEKNLFEIRKNKVSLKFGYTGIRIL